MNILNEDIYLKFADATFSPMCELFNGCENVLISSLAQCANLLNLQIIQWSLIILAPFYKLYLSQCVNLLNV